MGVRERFWAIRMAGLEGIKRRSLKQKFCADLNESRRRRTHDLPKRRAVDIPIDRLRSKKLRVVECIERFDSELQRLSFGQTEIFQQRQIEVVYSRPVEESPPGRSWSSQRILAELQCVEIGSAISGIMIKIKRASIVVWLINAIIVDAVRF